MADEGKVRKKVIIEYPAGTELSKSRKSADGLSPLVRSTDKAKNGVQTQVEIFPIEEDEEARPARIQSDYDHRPAPRRWEPTPAQRDFIRDAVGYGVDSVLDRLELALREWVAKRPARKNAEKVRLRAETIARNAAEAKHTASATPVVEFAAVPEPDVVETSSAFEVADDVPTISMSLADWKNALYALLLTHAMSSQLWQVLTHARIEGADADTLELQREMAQLTHQQLDDRLAELLKANPGLLDAPLPALLAKVVAAPPSVGQSVLTGHVEAEAQRP